MRRRTDRALSTVLGFMVAASIAGCARTELVPYQPTRAPITESPDALYAASIRVFLKHGWGFQQRDPSARAVETDWVNWSRDVGKWYQVSYRVIAYNDNLQIFTSCRLNDSDISIKDCPDGKRPKGIPEFEQQLVTEIRAEASLNGGAGPQPAARASGAERGGSSASCVAVCGNDRRECSGGCGGAQSCKHDCQTGYTACVKACAGTR